MLVAFCRSPLVAVLVVARWRLQLELAKLMPVAPCL
jgi:hypothetical protein